jgi:hypothetical protein
MNMIGAPKYTVNNGKPSARNWPKGADGATRSARRWDTATPRLQRPFGGAVTLGLSAGVRSTLGFRPPKLAGKTPRLDGRLPEDSIAAHDTTSKADASGISMARSWPRRAGVRPAWTHTNLHEQK